MSMKKDGLFQIIQRFTQFVSQLTKPNSKECLYCNGAVGNSGGGISFMGLCSSCQTCISWIREVKCDVCGRNEDCSDCKKRKDTFFVLNRSAVKYSHDMRNWLARYKYRGDEKLLPLFIEMLRFPFESLALEVAHTAQKKFDLITYIPVSSERLVERGFNQAKQFAEGLGELYNIPVISLLNRNYHTGKQSYKTREQRLDDLKGVFIFKKDEGFNDLIQSVHRLNILLVDDVYTTGSTLNQCASVIREHTKAQIYGLTWAR
jgi:competence protein ComFC